MNAARRFFSLIPKHNAPRFRNELSYVLDTLHSSKENIKNITLVKWNTGFNKGYTMTFHLENFNEIYNVEVLLRNNLNNKVSTKSKSLNNLDKLDNIDNIDIIDKLDNEYFKEKAEELAKKN